MRKQQDCTVFAITTTLDSSFLTGADCDLHDHNELISFFYETGAPREGVFSLTVCKYTY
jgi:hypothetical protein